MTAITKNDVCVLIPAYNEAAHIAPLLLRVKERGFPLIVVDDGSKDDTVARVKAAGVRVLETDKNGGKGAALRRGFEWFLGQKYHALIVMDADGQHDPEDLDLFLKALEQDRYEVIVGDRMSNAKGMPAIRYATNWTMSRIISWLAGQRIPDSQCGYRALKRHAVSHIPLSTDHFEIESEMLLEAAHQGMDIGSLPIKCVYGSETSSIRPVRDTLRFLKFIIKYLVRK